MFLGEPKAPGVTNGYTGTPVSMGELWAASRDYMVKAQNSDSEWVARKEAIDRINERIFRITGQKLENPFFKPDETYDWKLADVQAWHEQVKRIEAAWPKENFRVSIADIAKEAERHYQDVSARYQGGVAPFMAWLGGTFDGAMRDPINALTAVVGGGGTAKTFIGGVARAALINAGTEAMIQPLVKQWRNRHGLDHSWYDVTSNVIMAGVFGGTIDAAGRGAGTLISKLKDDQLEDLAQTTARPGPEADAVRGAQHELKQQQLTDALKPANILDEDHHHALVTATRHALDPDDNPPTAVPPAPVPPAIGPRLDDASPPPVKNGETFKQNGKMVTFGQFQAHELVFDADTFQFKGGGDHAGVTDKLRSVERWNPLAANKIFVFERMDGERVIADGHQRLGLAKRLIATGQENKITLDGYLFRAADGWTPSEVRVAAAKKNLQEGTGSVLDAARIIREAPEIIDRSVPLGSHMMRQARHLARLSDEAFGMVINEVVPANHAALVAEHVADPARHAGILRELSSMAPQNEAQARQMIRDMIALPMTFETQMTLFGERTEVRSLFKERARIMDGAEKALRDERKIFKTLTDNADRIETRGNILARGENATIAQQAATVGELIGKLASRHGPVSDALTRQAIRLSEGSKLADVRKAFVDEVREMLDEGGIDALINPPSPPRLLPDDENIEPHLNALAHNDDELKQNARSLLGDAADRPEEIVEELMAAEAADRLDLLLEKCG